MPRFSTIVYDENGRPIGIACGSRRKAPPCYLCGSVDAPLLCDGLGCDKPVCRACSTRAGRNRDFCRICVEKGAIR